MDEKCEIYRGRAALSSKQLSLSQLVSHFVAIICTVCPL